MLSKAKWNIKCVEQWIREDEGDFGWRLLNTGINTGRKFRGANYGRLPMTHIAFWYPFWNSFSNWIIFCFPQPFPAEIPASMTCVKEGRIGLLQDPPQFQVRPTNHILWGTQSPQGDSERIPFQGFYIVFLGDPAVLIHRPLELSWRVSRQEDRSVRYWNTQYKEETRNCGAICWGTPFAIMTVACPLIPRRKG